MFSRLCLSDNFLLVEDILICWNRGPSSLLSEFDIQSQIKTFLKEKKLRWAKASDDMIFVGIFSLFAALKTKIRITKI